MIKKLLIILGCIVLCVFILSIGIYFYLKHTTASQTSGNIVVTGITGPVSIYRDRYGIPHINAPTSDYDAFFALGFVHAQDRFWQMEFQRHVAGGRLSEIFGKPTLQSDIYLRTFNFYNAAQKVWNSFDANAKNIVMSYTAGVNTFIQQGRFPLEIKLLGYQPKPWSNLDSLVWQKVMAWDLQRHSWMNKINNALVSKYNPNVPLNYYYPAYPQDGPLITLANKKENIKTILKKFVEVENKIGKQLHMQATNAKGSNGWVLSGQKTTTGKPLLANDLHLDLSAPGVWYLVEIRGLNLHVVGASLPGMPAIPVGHNDQIAWGVTNGNNDAADLYILQSKDSVTIRHEKIIVRGNTPFDYEVTDSEYGPVINSAIPELNAVSNKIALKWPALFAKDTTAQSFLKILYAKDWQQFVNALKDFVTPTQNFLYADTAGNIGYYYPGLLPIRAWQSLTPVTTEEKYNWQGYIPFELLPHAFNPAQSYIATANNKVVDDTYPFTINARWPTSPYRAQRIVDLLQTKSIFSVTDMRDIQADTVDLTWSYFKSYLLNIEPLDEPSKTAIKFLQNWSGNMAEHLVAPTIFAYWVASFNDLIPKIIQRPNKNIESLYLLQLLQNNLSKQYLQNHLRSAMQNLIKQHGNNPNAWTWGKIHHVTFIGEGLGESKYLGWIWNRNISNGGGDHTINMGAYNPITFNQTTGPSYRQILDLSNLADSLFSIPMGQSGNPFSKHYDDFILRWRNVAYVKIKPITTCQTRTTCLILIPQ